MDTDERALRYILTIEAISGQNGNKSTFKVAATLRNGFALSVEEALPIMLQWNEHNATPQWSEKQIIQKLISIDHVPPIKPLGYLLTDNEMHVKGLQRGDQKDLPKHQKPRWPSCNAEAVIDLLDQSLVTREEFRQSSPIAPSEVGSANEIIDYLYCQGEDPDPILCLGKSVFKSVANTRENLRARLATESWELMVPNPLAGFGAETSIGSFSPRAKSNIKERRFIVIECDFDRQQHPEIFTYLDDKKLKVHDLCATILVHLSKTAPAAMAVNSGNKSIHGWFPVQGATRRVQYEFFRSACALGADPHMAQPNQWTRFPNGFRSESRERQTVEYLNNDRFIIDY